jgi:toxin-antitoxin system PIN domain toxin
MISIDANILLYSYCAESPFHTAARNFLEELSDREDVALSEFVLAEFYLLLRNPAVLARPLSAPDAAQVIATYRKHPHWKTLGFAPRSRELHDDLWKRAADPEFARRRIYDARTALSLTTFGVTDFATLNLKDFQDFGFRRVWNPLVS